MIASNHTPGLKRPRLILSIDPIAAMRISRKSNIPDPIHFALESEMAGIDGIKAHLRLDRRHIQEQDVDLLIKQLKTDFFLQLSINQDVVHLVNTFRPKYVILVAERRDEVTTETGLDVTLLSKQILHTVRELDTQTTKVFLAVDPELDQIRAAAKIEVHGLCISLRDYMLGNKTRGLSSKKHIAEAVKLSLKYGLETHFFNSITWQSLPFLTSISGISAIHIGHQFISMCLFKGIESSAAAYQQRLSRQ
ncbi:MAG: hypothetical protein CSA81_01730 [Acidobacteria bacterium]|nr:MAG: hypothetical protein CSA81_01730 [Acidobacteriota bacterium]PIE91481.1 MAG: hypothetical protein CR997_00820 [Acidobacteriota bacterium]